MASARPDRPPDRRPDGEDGRWTRAANGIAAVVVGFVVFGLGVGYGFGPLEVIAAIVIVAGAITLLRALLAGSRK